MAIKDMIKFAREGNLVRFQRAFRESLAEKIPAAIHNERVKMADRLFNSTKRG